MIYTIYLCPVSFCPSVSFCPLYHFAPLRPSIILPPRFILPPRNLVMYTIFPFPYHFAPPPLSFCPPIILPPWKLFHDLHYLPMSSIILPPGLILPPIILPPPPPPWKWFNDLHYLPMSRIILPPALDFVFILIKRPLQQKLMTGAHPVTVAPLVDSVLLFVNVVWTFSLQDSHPIVWTGSHCQIKIVLHE